MCFETELKLNPEMHLEAVIKKVWRCIWILQSCNSEMHLDTVIDQDVDKLGGNDCARLVGSLEVVDWRCAGCWDSIRQ